MTQLPFDTGKYNNGPIHQAMDMAEEEKKKGTVEKAGEATGETVEKGVGAVKGFGKGLAKGLKKKEE